MKIFMNIVKEVKRCWDDISFKDKGLIIIMIILLIQCIHNLYNGTHTEFEYESINIIIRTSVAGIFGYFLSSNFLAKVDDIDRKSKDCELKYLEELMQDEEIQKRIKMKCKIETNEEKEKEKYICNKNLQNLIAISICIICLLVLMIGINFELLPKDGITATVSQLRDLISGCIGFLLGGNILKDSNSKGTKK